MKALFAVVAGMCVVFTCSQAQEATVEEKAASIRATNSAELAANIGRQVAVDGLIDSATKGPDDGARFLNFSAGNAELSARIVPEVYPDLKPLEEYEGKLVKVTGELEASEDKMQINVTNFSQVQFHKPTVRVDFSNASIGFLALLYDVLTYRPVVCDPSTEDAPKVVIDNPGEISRTQAISLIEESLKAAGYTLTPMDDGGVRISYGNGGS